MYFSFPLVVVLKNICFSKFNKKAFAIDYFSIIFNGEEKL